MHFACCVCGWLWARTLHQIGCMQRSGLGVIYRYAGLCMCTSRKIDSVTEGWFDGICRVSGFQKLRAPLRGL